MLKNVSLLFEETDKKGQIVIKQLKHTLKPQGPKHTCKVVKRLVYVSLTVM